MRPGRAAMRRRAPEPLHQRPVRRVLEVHVRGELVREAADLAPAHRVGLAGDRERRRARLADAAGRQVAVDDRVDLVGAARRLVDALLKERDDLRRFRRTTRRSASRSRHRRPHVRATWSGVQADAACNALGGRCDALVSSDDAGCASARWASRPLNSATSLPGRSGRCRSASPAVSVRRGSMHTIRMAAFFCRAATMRW